MAARLGGLPGELLQMIICCLQDDRPSILALRATGRELLHRLSGLFKTFFRKRNLRLSVNALNNVLSACATCGGSVEELTILIPYRDRDWSKPLQERRDIASLLAQCFGAINRTSEWPKVEGAGSRCHSR
jgi:hypothetical protein